MRILLIEDDQLIGRSTKKGLVADGFTVDWVESGELGLTALATHEYDTVLLDLGLPGQDGYDILQSIRRKGHRLPVLVVTARGDISERIQHLDGGADDFIIKPFDLTELAARIRVGIRRAHGRAEDCLQADNLKVFPSKQLVVLDDNPVALTGREYKILLTLMTSPKQVLSRAQIEEAIYGWGEEIESNSLEVHIHHLRKKIGKHWVKTVHGLGYRLGEV